MSLIGKKTKKKTTTTTTTETGNSRGRRRWMIFEKLMRKESWRWNNFFGSSAFKWKRLNLRVSFMDNVVFKILSVCEAVVLVGTLCFFFLCCGCQF